MTNSIVWLSVLVVVGVGAYLAREIQLRIQVQEITQILTEINLGNNNQKLFISPNHLLAPIVFQVNQLIQDKKNIYLQSLQADNARKMLLSNLSHDVRTPLTSVLGYLDALCTEIAPDQSTLYLQTAQSKAYALKEYIDELFTMARLEAHELPIHLEPIDLYECLREECIGWIPEIEGKNLSFDVQIPDEEAYILADAHALARVINNLIQNAIRYGQDGGMIGVRTWSDNQDRYVEVYDQGAGIPTTDLKKIFLRSYRNKNSHVSSGLGLAITKELVQKMGGSISAISTPYERTSMFIQFPACKKK